VGDQPTAAALRLQDEYTLVGSRFSSGWAKEQQVFFAIRFSIPVKDLAIYEDKNLIEGTQGKALRGLISLKEVPDLVELKVGISPVSTDNALANIQAEIPNWDFDKVVKDASRKWNDELSKISIETTDESRKKIFYTSLYHAFMHPSLFNDHNKDYQGADNKIYKNASFNNYTIFSTWDTYRAAHPLFTLLQPERMNDFVNSMLAIYDQQGHLPIWHLNGYETGTMVGISSLQIIAEAYLKGYAGFDAKRAYDAIRSTAMSDLRGLGYVQKLKPIPSDVKIYRSVGHGLELALSDGSIALMAKALGKKEDHEYFKQRADNYKLYYDDRAGFFRGKMSDGSWNPTFDPVKSTKPWAQDYAEGNAWQYLWLAPQDVPGLMTLLGGEKKFVERLDEFFNLNSAEDSEALVDLTGTIGQYAHGNEPSHHIAYLYNYAGQPWKAAEKVRYIMDEFYHDDPDGLIGNEDCGQMSSWYIFSSLGFYPVFPASGKYVIGSPLFDKAVIHLEGGKNFTVTTEDNGPGKIYIQSVELNGKRYNKSYLEHKDIVKGGTMKVTMGSTPDVDFGKAQKDRP
jgi:predicted alpha-1,2-mannosidase